MKIVLRNGEKIELIWSPLVIEYLEDYEGGIEQLHEDVLTNETPFKTFNFMMYSFISAVYPKEISYREAISLVNPADLNKIVDFMVEQFNSVFEEKENEIRDKKRKHRR